MREGYQEFTRGDSSKFFLCDKCIKFGFITGEEEKMIQHVLEIHGIQQQKEKCKNEYLDEDCRRYLDCELEKGHGGDHKFTEEITWRNSN